MMKSEIKSARAAQLSQTSIPYHTHRWWPVKRSRISCLFRMRETQRVKNFSILLQKDRVPSACLINTYFKGYDSRGSTNVSCCTARGSTRNDQVDSAGRISAATGMHGHGASLEAEPGSWPVEQAGAIPAGTVSGWWWEVCRYPKPLHAISGDKLNESKVQQLDIKYLTY